MGFSRQEYWNGWPFPSPGDLPDPGIEPESHTCLALAGRFFTTESPGKPCPYVYDHLFFFFFPAKEHGFAFVVVLGL